jgi:N-methylhydantoinase A
MYLEMENQGAVQLSKEGFEKTQIELLRRADMRYVGQSYELTIDVSAESIDATVLKDLKNRFHQIHEKAYGYARLGEQIELVNLRLIALGKLPQSELVEPWPQTDKSPEPIDWRDVHFDGQNYRTPIHQRDHIGRDHTLAGPAIIEQLDSTTVIPPGYRGYIEPYGNMIIEKEVEA